MDRRRFFASTVAALLAAPSPANAQALAKVYRIGLLQNTPPSTPDAARLARIFIEALEERGFVEGRNVVFERRYVEGRIQRIPAFAAELVQLNCDAIVVTSGDVGIRALQELTATIPIVMAGASDPVRDGFAASLARPGGNITGVTSASLDLISKQLELLKTAAPGVRRVVFLTGRFGAGDEARAAELQRNRDAAAKALAMDLVRVEMPAPEDFVNATSAILRARAVTSPSRLRSLRANSSLRQSGRNSTTEQSPRPNLPHTTPPAPAPVATVHATPGNTASSAHAR